MSGRNFDGPWYPPPSVPLPADGIRARSARGRIGETWWSGRFIAVLESFGMGTRLTRGRRYARSGQVLGLDVAPGLATATVQGSRRAPYRVEVSVATLTEREWARAELALAAEARFMAALLAGEMPADIEEAFAGCKLSLFPASRRALGSQCSCPDWANPCKHVAAVLYILAERFDEDPFLVLAWRGRTKEQLIERLRELRAAQGPPAAAQVDPDAGELGPSAPPLEALLERFWQIGALTPLAPPGAVEEPDLVLRELGPIPAVAGGAEAARLLTPLYRAMSDAAVGRGPHAGEGGEGEAVSQDSAVASGAEKARPAQGRRRVAASAKRPRPR